MKIKHWICYCFLVLVILTLCWWICGDKWYRHGIQKKGREYIKLIELYLENTGKTPYSLDDLHAFRDSISLPKRNIITYERQSDSTYMLIAPLSLDDSYIYYSDIKTWTNTFRLMGWKDHNLVCDATHSFDHIVSGYRIQCSPIQENVFAIKTPFVDTILSISSFKDVLSRDELSQCQLEELTNCHAFDSIIGFYASIYNPDTETYKIFLIDFYLDSLIIHRHPEEPSFIPETNICGEIFLYNNPKDNHQVFLLNRNGKEYVKINPDCTHLEVGMADDCPDTYSAEKSEFTSFWTPSGIRLNMHYKEILKIKGHYSEKHTHKDKTVLLYRQDPNYFERYVLQRGKLVSFSFGQLHGHPKSTKTGYMTERTMSEKDANVANHLQIPVFGTDAMIGQDGSSVDIHVVLPSGEIYNNIGKTSGYEKRIRGNIGHTSLNICGRSSKPTYN